MGKISRMYATYASNFISRGSLVTQKALSSLSIKTVYSYIMTKKYATKVWTINYIPVHLQFTLSTVLRAEMRRLVPNAKVTVLINANRTPTSVSRDTFKRQYLRSEESYNDYKKAFDSVNNAQREVGVNLGQGFKLRLTQKELDKRLDKYDSYKYVNDHSLSGGTFFKTNVFIQVSTRNTAEAITARTALEGILEKHKFQFGEITGGTSDYIKQFGPAGYVQDGKKQMPSLLCSDENLAYMLPANTRGLIGGRGVLFGLDMLSKFPLILNPFETSAAQIMLLLGMAGSGKTALAIMLAIGFASRDIHVNIVDYKGGEYVKMDFAVKPLVIDIDGNAKTFVNMMRMDDLEVDEKDCNYIYNLTISSVTEWFSIISRTYNSKYKSDLEGKFRSAVIKAYTSLSGFNPSNPETYHLTKKLSYEVVISILEDNIGSLSLEVMKEDYARAVTNIRTYLLNMPSGGRELTLRDVINSKVVIYSLNKNTNPGYSLNDSVKIFEMQYLNRKKHYFRSKQGLHTVEAYEEITRVEETASNKELGEDAKRLLLFISQTISGSRSDNVTVMLMLNNLASLKSKDMSAIRSNITTLVVGKISEDDISELSENFGGRGIESYLQMIRSGKPKYQNCFAISFDSGKEVKKALFKAIIPEAMEERLRQKDVVVY